MRKFIYLRFIWEIQGRDHDHDAPGLIVWSHSSANLNFRHAPPTIYPLYIRRGSPATGGLHPFSHSIIVMSSQAKEFLDPYTAAAENDDLTPQKKIDGLNAIVKANHFGMLTTVAPNGEVHSRCMAPASTEGYVYLTLRCGLAPY